MLATWPPAQPIFQDPSVVSYMLIKLQMLQLNVQLSFIQKQVACLFIYLLFFLFNSLVMPINK